jgi:hypothetical protein
MAAAVAVLVSSSGAASDASSDTRSAAGRLLLMPGPSGTIMNPVDCMLLMVMLSYYQAELHVLP